MDKTYLTLREIQMRELEILKKFIEFCNSRNLRYYICGGTLLGAVRHKGFIPWDDDIDILMPRPDYEKLQVYARVEAIGNGIEVRSLELGNLNDPFCKICDSRTLIEKEYSDDECDSHLWIDIFPMDGLPEEPSKVRRIYQKVLTLRSLIRVIKVRPEMIRLISKSKFKEYMKYLLKPILILIGKKRINQMIRNICIKHHYEDCVHAGGIAFGYGPQECMIRREWEDATIMEFESIEVTVPGCWDKYLRNLYGDYMVMPPKEKQVAHYMKVWVSKES